MSSSDHLTKQILSRLGAVEVEDHDPQNKECPFDCSSEFSILNELNEDVHRLNSNVITLGAKIEARGHEITELRSQYRSLSIDQQRVKGEVKRIKEIATGHAERLDEVDKKLETLHGLRPIIYENKEKIAKMEERMNDLDARLDDEKRQRRESDSSLGLLILGLLFLGLVLHKKPETQAQKELMRGELAAMKAREWVPKAGLPSKVFLMNRRNASHQIQ